MAANRKRPVTVITGFLGSGKTTLLGKVLTDPTMRNTAVLVNEFGKVGLDHHLLQRIDENTILLGGGCVCCSTRDDLVKGLNDLLNKVQRGDISSLERVVVETTGLADPAPILFTILTNPVLQHHFYIDNVIVTVDAVNGHLHLDRQAESTKQVAVADKIIVTKTDIAPEESLDSLMARLRSLNPSAEIMEASFGGIDPKTLFDSSKLDDSGLGDFKTRSSALAAAPFATENDQTHVSETRSISIVFDKPIDWTAFGLWLSMLLHARGEDVLRVKGIVDVGEVGPVVLNGVQHIIHPPEHLNAWPSEDRRSRVIFIMRSIDPQDVLKSLRAFQHVLGAQAELLEMEVLV
jgi:G3E family GTPase